MGKKGSDPGMSVIHAWQHLFARAEQDQSPRGLTGFQTLRCSERGISPAEVMDLEPRLFYYGSPSSGRKNIFYCNPQGNFVLSNIVPIPDLDRAGRGGLYLAHSLLLSKIEILSLQSDPFILFDSFRFLTSFRDALETAPPRSYDLPQIELEISLSEIHDFLGTYNTWPVSELRKLAFLGLRASQLGQHGLSLAVTGEPPEVKETIRMCLWLVPTPLRTDCSFDTAFGDSLGYPCNIHREKYWASGLQADPGEGYIHVDTDSRTVHYRDQWKPANGYEVWVLEQIEKRSWEHFLRNNSGAYLLQQFMDRKTSVCPPEEEIAEDVVQYLFRSHPNRVTVLTGRIAERCPTILAGRLADSMDQKLERGTLRRGLCRGFDDQLLSTLLKGVYEKDEFRSPRDQEVIALGELLSTRHDSLLSLLYGCWTDQRELVQMHASSLDEEAYRGVLKVILRSPDLDPAWLLVAGREDVFISEYHTHCPKPGLCIGSVAAALTAIGRVDRIGSLAPLLETVQPEQLVGLADLVRNQKGTPTPFLVTLEEEYKHRIGRVLESQQTEGAIDFLSASVADWFVDVLVQQSTRHHRELLPICTVIKKLVTFGKIDLLSPLAPLIEHASGETAQELRTLLPSIRPVPPLLEEALQLALERIQKQKREVFLAELRSRFRYSIDDALELLTEQTAPVFLMEFVDLYSRNRDFVGFSSDVLVSVAARLVRIGHGKDLIQLQGILELARPEDLGALRIWSLKHAGIGFWRSRRWLRRKCMEDPHGELNGIPLSFLDAVETKADWSTE